MTPTRDDLIKLYEIKRLSTRKIGELFGVSKTQISRWFKLLNIEPRIAYRNYESEGIFKETEFDNKNVIRPTKKELYELIHVKYLSYSEIGKLYNVERTNVYVWVKKYNLETKPQWLNRKTGVTTEKELIQLYIIEKLPLCEIANKFNMTRTVLIKFFKKYNIKIRYSGFAGKRFTCTDGHLVMSSYEFRVDNWLCENGIEHIYEPPISYKTHRHADFFANGYYIEIWGVSKSDKYAQRRKEKQDFYKNNNIPLIEINWNDFATNRNELWKTKLEKLKYKIIKTPSTIKF